MNKNVAAFKESPLNKSCLLLMISQANLHTESYYSY